MEKSHNKENGVSFTKLNVKWDFAWYNDERHEVMTSDNEP